MKNLTILLIFLPFICISQPEFSFDLYFEDALGNRDTITLGYDPLATDGIDSQFGEENIIALPWDSVFEVRIGDKTYSGTNWLSDNSYLTKRQILQSYCDNSTISNRVSLQLKSTNFPVKVKWNRELFANDSCRFFSVLFGKTDYLNIDAINGTFLQFNDSLYININEQNEMNANFVSEIDQALTPYYYFLTYSTENKEIGVMQFVFYSFNAASIEQLSNNFLNVYPNPMMNGDILEVTSGDKYKLFYFNGVLCEEGKVINNKIHFSNFEKGHYFLQVETEGIIKTLKLIILWNIHEQ